MFFLSFYGDKIIGEGCEIFSFSGTTMYTYVLGLTRKKDNDAKADFNNLFLFGSLARVCFFAYGFGKTPTLPSNTRTLTTTFTPMQQNMSATGSHL